MSATSAVLRANEACDPTSAGAGRAPVARAALTVIVSASAGRFSYRLKYPHPHFCSSAPTSPLMRYSGVRTSTGHGAAMPPTLRLRPGCASMVAS